MTEMGFGEYAALRKQSCLRKTAYTSKRKANARVKELVRAHAYFCTFCAYWHVGRFGKTAAQIESTRPKDATR